jgi:uncharacterized protein YkwD
MYLDITKEPNRDGKWTIFLLILSVAFLMFCATCEGQVYTAADLPTILNRSDSISRIELLAAKKFHAKLNEYRKQKGVNPLKWNDTLFLAAHNHNQWMTLNKRMTHDEFQLNYNFTGYDPTERVTYVCGQKVFYCAENIAPFGVVGKTIDEIAEVAATTALNAWKNDKPHDDNMLDKHKRHGIAFSLKGGYCTDDFASNYHVNK